MNAKAPWLARKDWASRRVAAQEHPAATVAMAALFVVPIAFGAGVFWLLAFAAGYSVPGVVAGGLFFLLGLHVLWRRIRWEGTVWSDVQLWCILETLPGVIGGWFKGQVEARLPAPPKGAVVRLVFLEGMYDGEPNGIWSVRYELEGGEIKRIGDGLFRFPVRFEVPARLAQFTRYTGWRVTVEIALQNKRLVVGSFPVPIYATSRAPAQEQAPETPFRVEEETDVPRWASWWRL